MPDDAYPFDPDDEIHLGDDEGPDLGPDERDADLMDGSWEQRHYRRTETRDWQSVYAGIALLIVMALVIPLLLAAFR